MTGRIITDAIRGFTVERWMNGSTSKVDRITRADLEAEGHVIVDFSLVRAVAQTDPIWEHGCGDTGCFFCGVDDYTPGQVTAETVDHADDCPWTVCRDIVVEGWQP